MAATLATRQRWTCPNCPTEDVTAAGVPNRFHTCKGLRGLTAPLVRAGTRCEVVAVEREDYVGRDQVQLDPERGRPVMAVVTRRDDGEDRIVFAPHATARIRR